MLADEVELDLSAIDITFEVDDNFKKNLLRLGKPKLILTPGRYWEDPKRAVVNVWVKRIIVDVRVEVSCTPDDAVIAVRTRNDKFGLLRVDDAIIQNIAFLIQTDLHEILKTDEIDDIWTEYTPSAATVTFTLPPDLLDSGSTVHDLIIKTISDYIERTINDFKRREYTVLVSKGTERVRVVVKLTSGERKKKTKFLFYCLLPPNFTPEMLEGKGPIELLTLVFTVSDDQEKVRTLARFYAKYREGKVSFGGEGDL